MLKNISDHISIVNGIYCWYVGAGWPVYFHYGVGPVLIRVPLAKVTILRNICESRLKTPKIPLKPTFSNFSVHE